MKNRRLSEIFLALEELPRQGNYWDCNRKILIGMVLETSLAN